jgi:hypothetical protein
MHGIYCGFMSHIIEVVLRHFYRHCYKGSLAVILCWRGLKSLVLAMDKQGEY